MEVGRLRGGQWPTESWEGNPPPIPVTQGGTARALERAVAVGTSSGAASKGCSSEEQGRSKGPTLTFQGPEDQDAVL